MKFKRRNEVAHLMKAGQVCEDTSCDIFPYTLQLFIQTLHVQILTQPSCHNSSTLTPLFPLDAIQNTSTLRLVFHKECWCSLLKNAGAPLNWNSSQHTQTFSILITSNEWLFCINTQLLLSSRIILWDFSGRCIEPCIIYFYFLKFNQQSLINDISMQWYTQQYKLIIKEGSQ